MTLRTKWRTWPYWLKCGVILPLLVMIIVYAGGLIESSLLNTQTDMGTPTTWLFIVISLPVLLLRETLGVRFPIWLYFVLTVFCLLIFGIAIGAFIDLIKLMIRKAGGHE